MIHYRSKGDPMEKSIGDDLSSVLILDIAKESAKEYQYGKLKVRRQIEEGFFNQPVDYREFILSPEGYEGATLTFYVVTAPYVAGLLFLFLFIARAQLDLFIEFNLTSFFIIWAIGYEVCAALILIGIFIAWLKYISDRWNKEQERKKAIF